MGILNNLANGFRNNILSRESLLQRKEIDDYCSLGKVGCVVAVTVVVASAVFHILSGTFSGLLLGMVCGGFGLTLVHDAYRLIDNIQQIYDDALTEISARASSEKLKTHLSRGMIVAKPLVNDWINS